MDQEDVQTRFETNQYNKNKINNFFNKYFQLKSDEPFYILNDNISFEFTMNPQKQKIVKLFFSLPQTESKYKNITDVVVNIFIRRIDNINISKFEFEKEYTDNDLSKYEKDTIKIVVLYNPSNDTLEKMSKFDCFLCIFYDQISDKKIKFDYNYIMINMEYLENYMRETTSSFANISDNGQKLHYYFHYRIFQLKKYINRQCYGDKIFLLKKYNQSFGICKRIYETSVNFIDKKMNLEKMTQFIQMVEVGPQITNIGSMGKKKEYRNKDVYIKVYQYNAHDVILKNESLSFGKPKEKKKKNIFTKLFRRVFKIT